MSIILISLRLINLNLEKAHSCWYWACSTYLLWSVSLSDSAWIPSVSTPWLHSSSWYSEHRSSFRWSCCFSLDEKSISMRFSTWSPDYCRCCSWMSCSTLLGTLAVHYSPCCRLLRQTLRCLLRCLLPQVRRCCWSPACRNYYCLQLSCSSLFAWFSDSCSSFGS